MASIDNRKGYILTDGNLFYHKNVEVEMHILNYTDGYRVLVFVRTDSDFEELHKYMQKEQIDFSVHRNAALRYGKGFFPISFQLGLQLRGDKAESIFSKFNERIRENKSASIYIDSSKY